MRIILAIPYNPLLEVSGLELISIRLAGEFIRRGHEAMILTKGPGGVWGNGVRIVGLGDIQTIGRWLLQNSDRYDVLQWMEIFPELREFEIQCLWSSLLACHLNKPVYLMVATPGNMKARTEAVWHPLMRESISGFVVFNEAQVDEMGECGIPASRVFVLAAGVDTSEVFRPPGPGERDLLRQRHGWHLSRTYFLYVGRFVDRKKPDFLLRLWAELTDVHASSELVLIGSGMGHRESIEDLVVDLARRTPSVRLLPPVMDTWNYYRAADVVVVPSVREGGPVVVYEAMATGLPVIASAIPGPTSVIRDGETGFLCPPDDAKAFGDAIRHLANNEEARRNVGMRARDFIRKERDIRVVAERYLRLYETGTGFTEK